MRISGSTAALPSSPAPVRLAAVAVDGNGNWDRIAVASSAAAAARADDDVAALSFSLAFAAGLHADQVRSVWERHRQDERHRHAGGEEACEVAEFHGWLQWFLATVDKQFDVRFFLPLILLLSLPNQLGVLTIFLLFSRFTPSS